MKRFLIALLVAATGFTIWQFPSWNVARQQLAIAEQRVEAAIAEGMISLSFKDLTELRHLPSNIKDAKRLEYLTLNGTNISKIAGIESLSNLKQLNLNFTRVADLTPLTGLPKLRLIYLHGTWVEDLTPLASLPSLEQLDIGKTQSNSLEPVTRIVQLNWLNLYKAYALDGSTEYYSVLAARLTDLTGGSSFQKGYRPDWLYQTKVRYWRLKERLGLENNSA